MKDVAIDKQTFIQEVDNVVSNNVIKPLPVSTLFENLSMKLVGSHLNDYTIGFPLLEEITVISSFNGNETIRYKNVSNSSRKSAAAGTLLPFPSTAQVAPIHEETVRLDKEEDNLAFEEAQKIFNSEIVDFGFNTQDTLMLLGKFVGDFNYLQGNDLNTKVFKQINENYTHLEEVETEVKDIVGSIKNQLTVLGTPNYVINASITKPDGTINEVAFKRQFSKNEFILIMNKDFGTKFETDFIGPVYNSGKIPFGVKRTLVLDLSVVGNELGINTDKVQAILLHKDALFGLMFGATSSVIPTLGGYSLLQMSLKQNVFLNKDKPIIVFKQA